MVEHRGRLAKRIAEYVRVTGRVQGVGFRWFACQSARECDVDGWVRNLPDGSVDAHVEGAPESVERMIELLRSGPLGGRVDRVERRRTDATGERGEFRVRF